MGEGLLPYLLTYFLRRWKTPQIFETSKPTDTQGKAAQKIRTQNAAVEKQDHTSVSQSFEVLRGFLPTVEVSKQVS